MSPWGDAPDSARARRMEARVIGAARNAGVPAGDAEGVRRALRAAMAVRELPADPTAAGGLPAGDAAAPEGGGRVDLHPGFLHPGRTVLILLDDLGERDARVLAVGALAESRESVFRVSEAAAEAALTAGRGDEDPKETGAHPAHEALDWWRALPLPEWTRSGDAFDEALLERLVVAPPPVRRVALAEALDQLRHAHLWDAESERARAVELARTVFGPLAPRVHPTLERRIDWWLRRVGPGLLSRQT